VADVKEFKQNKVTSQMEIVSCLSVPYIEMGLKVE